ncbi:MAG: hypothetical protein ABGX16_25875 [Pirellulales bacterium]
MNEKIDMHLEQQQALLEGSLTLVFTAYDQAVADGVGDPVVILLDCEDPIGEKVARGWLGDEAVDIAVGQVAAELSGQVELSGKDEQTTVFAYAFAWEACQQEVPAVFPYLAPMFEQPPPQDGFLAISVTSGGASALTVPWDARES